MPETTFEKIQRITGREVSECNCCKCQEQCKTPCIGTPDDILKLVEAGYSDRLAPTVWAAGILMGATNKPINMIAPEYDKEKGSCTFLTNGKCELHEKGLKPTEGKLSHHTLQSENYNVKENLTWNVAREWLGFSEYLK